MYYSGLDKRNVTYFVIFMYENILCRHCKSCALMWGGVGVTATQTNKYAMSGSRPLYKFG